MTDVSGVVLARERVGQIRDMLARAEGTAPSGFGAALASAAPSGVGPASGSAPSGNGSAVVSVANRYLGVPYVYGGSDPQVGLDCSGFTQLVFRQFGIELPRGSIAQAETGTAVPSLADARPGDLVFTYGDPDRVNGHVGIYVGDGKWIAAPYTGEVVKVENVPTEITAIRREL